LINADIPPSVGWFTFEDVPLKWHHPIGLLFDLYSRAKEQLVAETHGKDIGSLHEASEDSVLPWQLTVHFSAWPSDTLVPLDTGGKVLQDAFNNGVKEASYIRHGSGKVIMSLGKEATEQLWEAVQKVDGDLYANANAQLIHRKGEAVKHIPIKIYLPAMSMDDSQGNTKAGHLRVVQGLVMPKMSNRTFYSL
jgi:autophagy-related protein 5